MKKIIYLIFLLLIPTILAAPTITINRPIAVEDYGYNGYSQELNWTVSDVNLYNCWYEYYQNNLLNAYFAFDESSGTTALNSANATNNMTLTNAVFRTSGKNNNGVYFDGTGDAAQTASAVSGIGGTGEFTYSMWINKTAATTGVLAEIASGADTRLVSQSAGNLRLFMAGNDTGSVGSGIATDGTEWNFVVVKREGGYIKLYLNNVLIGQNLTTGTIPTDAFRLGEGGGDYYTGMIDEVAIWGRALSDSELTSLYNSGSGIFYSSLNNNLIISNTTVNCTNGVANATNFNIANSATNLTFYANDTSGNINSSFVDWVYKIFYNSETYNSSTYETALESYSINVTANSSLTAVNLIWNGTAYSTTKSGEIWSRSFDIPVGAGTKNIYWNFTYDGSGINNTPTTLSVSETNFSLCGGVGGNTLFLNLSFKDEADNSILNATIPTSTFTYYLGTGSVNKTYSLINNTANLNYLFCGIPNKTINVIPYIQYARDGYPQRVWNPEAQQYSNSTTNKTLYLLATADGIYVTFQVVNSADQVLSGVVVTATRSINGIDVVVGQGTTGSDGTVTLWLNPDFSHDFSFVKTGFTTYETTFAPTQSGYTISLSGGGTTINNYFQGITYSLLPIGSLVNDTTYSFEFNVSSSFWDVSSFGFNLRLSNGTIVGSDSSTSTGSAASYSYNVNNQSIIYMDYYWIINGTYTNATKYWIIYNTQYDSWSIKTFFTDLSTYMSLGIFGLDDFGRYLITFIVLFVFVGVMSYKYGLTSPLSILSLIFSTVLFLETVVGLIPPIRGINNLLTYITGLVLLIAIFAEVQR